MVFSNFFSYVRDLQIQTFDDVEYFHKKEAVFNYFLQGCLGELDETGSTNPMRNKKTSFVIEALFFLLNLMEFIIKFSKFSRADQRRLVNRIKICWSLLNDNYVWKFDDVENLLGVWGENDDEILMPVVEHDFSYIRRSIKYLCYPAPVWNENPWMWAPENDVFAMPERSVKRPRRDN